MRLTLATLLALTTATTTKAQTTSWYHASIGLEQSAQKNPAESPYVFSGLGSLLSLGYTHGWSSSSLDLSLDGGFGRLTSTLSGGKADHAHLASATTYLRTITTRSMLGAQLSLLTDATNQSFGTPFNSDDQFGYAAITLGPAARSVFHLRNATVTNDITVPILDLIDIPYANLKMEGGLHLRFHTINTVQGITDAVSYHVAAPGARNMAWTYRVTWLHVALGQPRTFARQSLSLTFNLPRRRLHP